jgi:hypothetical protein
MIILSENTKLILKMVKFSVISEEDQSFLEQKSPIKPNMRLNIVKIRKGKLN